MNSPTLDPKTLQPGDILRAARCDPDYDWFVSRVTPEGVWTELLLRKPSVWPPNPRRSTTVTVWHTLAGHGSFLPFRDPRWWRGTVKVGSLPGLVGKGSLRIET